VSAPRSERGQAARGGPARRELVVLEGEEQAVQRVVAIEADPAVDVLRPGHHAMTSVPSDEPRDVDRASGVVAR
jgi:hypothetical protein